jgi:hypothetical protein
VLLGATASTQLEACRAWPRLPGSHGVCDTLQAVRTVLGAASAFGARLQRVGWLREPQGGQT